MTDWKSDPAILAAADQDLAVTKAKLDEILEAWAKDRGDYPDLVERICVLMGFMAGTTYLALQALLAVAIERLSEEAA